METKLNTEEPKQDKSKLDNAVHSLLLQNRPGLAERYLWFLGGFSTSSWLHFPDGAGASLWGSYWHGHCHLGGANFDKHVRLCTFVNRLELRVRAFISFYTTFPKKLRDPKKKKEKNPNIISMADSLICSVRKKEQRVSVHMVYFPRGLCDLSNYHLENETRRIFFPRQSGPSPKFPHDFFCRRSSQKRERRSCCTFAVCGLAPIPKLLAA